MIVASLLLLTTCQKEFSSQKESGFLFFEEPGDFRLNTLQELSDGKLLVAGTTSIRFASTTFAIDSATLYIVDPNNYSYKRIQSISEFSHLFCGAIEAEGQSLIVWAMDRISSLSVLIKFDKNYQVVKQVPLTSLTPFRGSYNLTILKDGAINSIIQLKDGNFLLEGQNVGLKSQLVKFDKDLNIIWRQESDILLRDFVETSDASILSAGYNEVTHKAVILKYSSEGNLIWEKNLNLPLNASFYNVLSNNSFYWGSGYFSWSPDFQGKTEGFITKFNENGDSLFCKTFISALDDEGHKILPTADGGFIFLMHREYLASRLSNLIKLDADLNIIWEKPFGRNGDFVSLVAAITLKNGNIVIGGFGDHIVKDINRKDGYILVLDKNGNPI